jgi:hypothetical protein
VTQAMTLGQISMPTYDGYAGIDHLDVRVLTKA